MLLWPSCYLEEECLEGHKITVGHLQNPAVLPQLVRNEQAYKFLKNVRGFAAYWQDQLYDVLAMLHTLGILTHFLTLSAADLHLPEMIQAVAAQCGRKLSQKDVLKWALQTKADTCTKPHNWCLNISTQIGGILLWIRSQWWMPTRPYNRLCYKNEFQMRGSPHAQCLLWVNDATKLTKIQMMLFVLSLTNT